MIFLLGLPPALTMAFCVYCFFRYRTSNGKGMLLIRAVGWQSLWVLPAVLAQHIWVLSGMGSHRFSWEDSLASFPFSCWVLMGGKTVINLFESTAKALTGHRQFTMLDNWHYYLFLTFIQTLLIGVVLAFLLRKKRKFRHPMAFIIGHAVGVNAFLSYQWPWWGS